ncbi:hypothetical protein ALC53_06670 [Atta colombica]|uniref:Uncharacterized protein n=1 Tax=Atta colombica TaxID=520822 RepID=A0A195BEG0_9HYME|nr:hypothetical protein ALC53_06670 [Atta colombica]
MRLRRRSSQMRTGNPMNIFIMVSSHLSSRYKCRSTVRRSSDARCRSCQRSSRLKPRLYTSLRNPTPCLQEVSEGFELLLSRQQSRRPGVLRGRLGRMRWGWKIDSRLAL